MARAATSVTRQATALTLFGVMLAALNLRPAITSVAAVLSNIGDGLSLSATARSVLTTLPVLFLGFSAPTAPWLAQRVGIDRTILSAMVLLAVTLLARPYFDAAGLFVGTAVACSCIGVTGVLLPGIVKRDFAEAASLLTGIYTATLCVGAAAAAGITEPLRIALEYAWRPALAFWFIPAAIAAAVWWRRLGPKREPNPDSRPGPALLRDRLAWQITLYMALQAALAYTVLGWLPTILQDRGMAPIAAGLALSTSIMIQIASAIAAPWVASHMRDQRPMIVLAIGFMMVGLGGCIYAPISGVWFWIIMLGLGQGAAFSMALTLFAVRADNAQTAARLSSMAQGIGYIIGAFGPLIAGLLRDICGGWGIPGLFLGLIGFSAIVAGLGAGRSRLVGQS